MKISVYAICKNESAFCKRWAESMAEADEIVALDTGSTDDTVNILRENGVKVSTRVFNPWRFDDARNYSLDLVSDDTDICVCTDLDEVFEKGWREKLERAWVKGVKQARYLYIWSHDGDKAGVTFLSEKIHARQGFKWVNPVHEVLLYSGDDHKVITVDGVTLHHYPDESKSRASYLPLLELAVSENPTNDRNMHYLGREYMFRGQPDKAIKTLLRHLNLPTATWDEERCASMRYIAKCHLMTGNATESEKWLLRAVAECPFSREPLVEYAKLLFSRKDWHGVIFFLTRALSITVRTNSYISDPACWGALPYDLLSLAYYFTGNNEEAVKTVDKAIELSDEKRLKENRDFFLQGYVTKDD